jgi:hypothetical protein
MVESNIVVAVSGRSEERRRVSPPNGVGKVWRWQEGMEIVCRLLLPFEEGRESCSCRRSRSPRGYPNIGT